MKITIDNIQFNINVNSLQRSIVFGMGGNSGTFITGEKFNDVRHSYYRYSLTISPYLTLKSEYEQMYSLLSLPVESHEITLPYAQENITFKANVSSLSDRLRKVLPTGNIWEGFTVTFDGTEAII